MAPDAGDASGERWLPVVGWEGWYAVSSLGNLRRVRAGTGTRAGLLHPSRHVNGARCASLSRGGRVRLVLVHRLVAAAFLGPRPAHHRLDWRNGDRADNRVDNLHYRPKRNAPAPPRPRRGPHRALTDRQVREIRRLLATTGGSDLARRYAVSPATISRVKGGTIYRDVGDEP